MTGSSHELATVPPPRSARVTLLDTRDEHEDMPAKSGRHLPIASSPSYEHISSSVMSCLISQHEEVMLVEERYGHHAWQTEVVHFLHSVTIQVVGMVLLILDVFIIIAEVYIDIEWPSCSIIERDAVSCCNASALPVNGRRLAYDLCAAGLAPVPEFGAGCDYHAHPGVHVAHELLLWMSVSILALFGLELIILFAIEQLVFLRNPLYVLDGIIIAAALSIDVRDARLARAATDPGSMDPRPHAFAVPPSGIGADGALTSPRVPRAQIYVHKTDSSELAGITGILILARSWRFVRIGHALYMVNKKNKSTKVFSDPIRQMEKRAKQKHGHAPHGHAPASKTEYSTDQPLGSSDGVPSAVPGVPTSQMMLETHPVVSLATTLEAAKASAGASELEVGRLVWARGVQTYEADADGLCLPTGPLADLYEAALEADGTLRLGRAKVGVHYQHLAAPAWEWEEGRVVSAAAAVPLPGASPSDVPWLSIDLRAPNPFGYTKMLRVETRMGQPPRTPMEAGRRHGSSYEAVYVCLKP